MGTVFLEITTSEPAYEMGFEERSQIKIAQGYAAVLDGLFNILPKPLRVDFPLLAKIEVNSGFYRDEMLILSPNEVRQLNDEFSLIIKACNYETFLKGLEASKFLRFWKANKTYPERSEKDFQGELDFTKNLLALAENNNAWIVVIR